MQDSDAFGKLNFFSAALPVSTISPAPAGFLLAQLVGAVTFLAGRQSTIGSVNAVVWPLASQTRGWVMIVPSMPTTSVRLRTTSFHQASLMLRFSSAPAGP